MPLYVQSKSIEQNCLYKPFKVKQGIIRELSFKEEIYRYTQTKIRSNVVDKLNTIIENIDHIKMHIVNMYRA